MAFSTEPFAVSIQLNVFSVERLKLGSVCDLVSKAVGTVLQPMSNRPKLAPKTSLFKNDMFMNEISPVAISGAIDVTQ